MPVSNSDDGFDRHFLHQNHLIGCQRNGGLQVALENVSSMSKIILPITFVCPQQSVHVATSHIHGRSIKQKMLWL